MDFLHNEPESVFDFAYLVKVQLPHTFFCTGCASEKLQPVMRSRDPRPGYDIYKMDAPEWCPSCVKYWEYTAGVFPSYQGWAQKGVGIKGSMIIGLNEDRIGC